MTPDKPSLPPKPSRPSSPPIEEEDDIWDAALEIYESGGTDTSKHEVYLSVQTDRNYNQSVDLRIREKGESEWTQL